jgi:nitrite reductase (NO-forming)
VLLNGLSGPIKVNGASFNSVMPNFRHLGNDDLSNILTYVYASWGNNGTVVTGEEIRKGRQGAI